MPAAQQVDFSMPFYIGYLYILYHVLYWLSIYKYNFIITHLKKRPPFGSPLNNFI